MALSAECVTANPTVMRTIEEATKTLNDALNVLSAVHDRLNGPRPQNPSKVPGPPTTVLGCCGEVNSLASEVLQLSRMVVEAVG